MQDKQDLNMDDHNPPDETKWKDMTLKEKETFMDQKMEEYVDQLLSEEYVSVDTDTYDSDYYEYSEGSDIDSEDDVDDFNSISTEVIIGDLNDGRQTRGRTYRNNKYYNKKDICDKCLRPWSGSSSEDEFSLCI
jgi:hypothetical protein